MHKLVSAAIGAAFGLLATTTLALSADAKKLTFSIWQQPEHYMVKGIRAWAGDVEKRSGGKVAIEFHYGGTLTSGPNAYDGIVNGISDMAAAASGWNPGNFPMTRITDIPLGWTSSEQASLASWDFYKKFEPKEWDKVHLLFLYTDAIGYLHTKKSVASTDDLKGMQVRGTGSDVPLIEAMGGTPVGMPFGEVYLSLQRGIVEGMISNYASVKAAKIGEVTGFTTEHNVRSAGFWVAMNKDTWNGLDPETQKAFDAASQAAVAMMGKVLDDAQAAGRAYVLEIGNKIVTPTDAQKATFDKALAPIRDEWVDEMTQKGLPGKEVLDFVVGAMKQHQS
jgi:TRAP-type C4-dicarboxylate transport system substrate-binding protein